MEISMERCVSAAGTHTSQLSEQLFLDLVILSGNLVCEGRTLLEADDPLGTIKRAEYE